MSEPQIPREVWGVWDHETNSLVEFATGNHEFAENYSIGYGQPRSQPVLIGGSALLDEVAKLRRVAEEVDVMLKLPPHETTGLFDNGVKALVKIIAAMNAAGYPKSTEATD